MRDAMLLAEVIDSHVGRLPPAGSVAKWFFREFGSL